MGGFFKRLDIVTIDDRAKKWSVDRVRELERKGEPFQMADLSDEGGATTSVATDRLTKVGG